MRIGWWNYLSSLTNKLKQVWPYGTTLWLCHLFPAISTESPRIALLAHLTRACPLYAYLQRPCNPVPFAPLPGSCRGHWRDIPNAALLTKTSATKIISPHAPIVSIMGPFWITWGSSKQISQQMFIEIETNVCVPYGTSKASIPSSDCGHNIIRIHFVWLPILIWQSFLGFLCWFSSCCPSGHH